jgi:cytosine/adenosine deaminase-related metal-dependent hydrolase
MQMIESGVTTVAHSFYEGEAGRYGSVLADTIRATEDTGIRAAMVLSILDQSFIESMLSGLLPGLPNHLNKSVQDFLNSRRQVTVEEYVDVLRDSEAKQQNTRARIMTGPVSVHWCSEDLLLRIWREAETLDVGIQTHLLESHYQQSQSLARYGKSAVEYLDDLGLLSSRLSCAHCVHVTERDIELLAASDTSVVHNASSNLRLLNGIAPIESMRRQGVNVALGLDSLALNDDEDMLHEMRLVSALHRASRDDQRSITARQSLAMASINGAKALGIEDSVGTLAPGKKADLVLVDLDRLDGDYADLPIDSADLLLHRAHAGDVSTVIVNGEIVMHEGQHTHLDIESLQSEIRKQLRGQTGASETSFKAMIAELKPYAQKLINSQRL